MPEDEVTVTEVLMSWLSYWLVTTMDPLDKVHVRGRVLAMAVHGDEGLM